MDKQDCLLFKENRTIKRIRIPIVGELVSDAKMMISWFRFREFLQPTRYQQVVSKQEYYILPIDERSSLPVSPYSPISDADLRRITDGDRVAEIAGDYEDQQMARNQRKTKFYDYIGIATLGIVFCFVLIAILAAAGKFDFGMITNMFGGGATP